MNLKSVRNSKSDSQGTILNIENLDLAWIRERLIKSGRDIILVEEAEQEYRRFLMLVAAFPGAKIVPTVKADIFWHEHILNTRRYFADSDLIFGFYLHHSPVSSKNEFEKHNLAVRKTRLLYRLYFGQGLHTSTASCSNVDDGSCWAGCKEERQ